MNNFDIRTAWDAVAQSYQEAQPLSAKSVSYGPLAPDEAELQLLGSMDGIHVLDIGCGGGQNSIAFARQGASVTGVDISERQLQFARTLAKAEKLSIEFLRGSVENLPSLPDAHWELAFSAYTFHYVENIASALAECRRVLRPGGRLVFSLDHPIRDCFYDQEDEEDTVYPARGYFDREPIRWHFGSTGVKMWTYHRTISEWIDLLAQSGFQLEKLLEPPLPDDVAETYFPEDDALAPRGNIPHTIIFSCVKPV